MKITAKTRTIITGLLTTALITAAIITGAALSSRKKLTFSAEFFYVCYDSPSDAASASSISSLVHSYGGAGYIIKNGRKFYVTVSCYYTESDAQSVIKTLSSKGLCCSVVTVKAGGYTLRGTALDGKVKKYDGNLNTLLQLSEICYDIANSLDDGSLSQQGAGSALEAVSTGLDSLVRQNVSNCFTNEIEALKAEYADASYGYIYSRDVRRLQIAFTDCIANVKLR